MRGGAAISAAVRAAPALCVPVRPGTGSVPSPVLPAPNPGPDTQGAGEAAVRVGGRETDQRRKHEPEPSLPTLILDQVEDWGARKAVSFRVKETVCPRPSLQPPEQCDFKENGLTLGAETEGWDQCFSARAEQGTSGNVSSPWQVR